MDVDVAGNTMWTVAQQAPVGVKDTWRGGWTMHNPPPPPTPTLIAECRDWTVLMLDVDLVECEQYWLLLQK